MFDEYDDACGDDEDVSGGYSNGLEEGPIDIGSDDDSDEIDDGDFLSQLLQHTKAELLVGSAKGIENFKTVKKSGQKNIYERSKGCSKHRTVLRFVLELLTLKAKHSWSDSSFNDLLAMLAWLLPKPNKVPANTYRAKKLVSPFTMGVERIHACPNHCILYRGVLSKTWTNVMYVLQIDTKTMLVIVVAIIKVQGTGTKGRGKMQ